MDIEALQSLENGMQLLVDFYVRVQRGPSVRRRRVGESASGFEKTEGGEVVHDQAIDLGGPDSCFGWLGQEQGIF